jgi:hypothetical protein
MNGSSLENTPLSALVEHKYCAILPDLKLNSLNETFRGTTRKARFAHAAYVRDTRNKVEMMLRSQIKTKPELPVVVIVTRIAPGRGLDEHDNLPGACKHVVDAIAKWLGVDDRDSRVVWCYNQRSLGREVAVLIRFERRPQ